MPIPIGGFMPIPLAMMIPFMATQSMVMGDAFGRAFQYGKRKISAMSNEEFNKTSIEQQASEMFASYKQIIPSLNKSIQDSQTLQEKIIREMLLILPRFATSEELFKPEPFTVGGKTHIQDFVTGGKTVKPPTAAQLVNPAGILANQQLIVDPLIQGISSLFQSLSRLINNINPGAPNNPEQIAFQNIPENEDISGAEYASATNDAAYKAAQLEKLNKTPNPASRAANPWTDRQLSKKAVIDSGLSPLATAAIKTFKSNIDSAAGKITMNTAALKELRRQRSQWGTKPTAATIRLDKLIIERKAKIQLWVKKLSALRIKYRSTYGEYY